MKNNELERVGEELEKTIKSSDTIEEVLKKVLKLIRLSLTKLKNIKSLKKCWN